LSAGEADIFPLGVAFREIYGQGYKEGTLGSCLFLEGLVPYVVIEGEVDLRQIFIRRPEMFLRDPDGIKRVSEYYLNTDCNRLLLEALVIEPKKKQQFFILVSKKSGGVTVRLEPLTNPEKTTGVKRLMGQVSHAIHMLFPNTRYGKTNIAEFLPKESPQTKVA
jgi:hypothetical protein